MACNWKSWSNCIILSLLVLGGCGGKDESGSTGTNVDANDQTSQVRQLAVELSPGAALERAPTPASIAGGITEDLRPPLSN